LEDDASLVVLKVRDEVTLPPLPPPASSASGTVAS
jgi:hypothetical protein